MKHFIYRLNITDRLTTIVQEIDRVFATAAAHYCSVSFARQQSRKMIDCLLNDCLYIGFGVGIVIGFLTGLLF